MPTTERTANSEFADRTTGHVLLRAGAWNAASLILPQVYVLATSVIAARFLTPAEMGRQSYIAFIELSLVLLVTGGLPSAVQRFAGEALGRGQPEYVAYLARWAWRLAAVGGVLAGGVMVTAAELGSEPRAAWILAGGFCFVGVLQAIPASSLAVLQRWRGVSIVGIVFGAVSTAALVAVLAAGGGITGLFAVQLATGVVTLLLTTWLARSALGTLGVEPVKSPELRWRATRWAVIATFTSVLTFVVWRRSEFLFLNHYSSDEQIAVYSIAFASVVAFTKLPEAVGMVISPAFATLSGARQMNRIRSGYGRAIRLILLVSLPLTALAIAVGPSAIRLVYGSSYSQAGELLVIMMLALPLLSLVSVSRGVIFGVARQRNLVMVGTFAAVVNVALDILLIHLYDATGAALANAGAQSAAAIAYVVVARRSTGPVDWAPGPLARNAVAACAAGAAAWVATAALPSVAGTLTGMALFATVFCVLAVMLRIMPAHDGPWLESVLAARLRGRSRIVARRMIAAASRA
jgi:O-antigen/teichoic acid export membrane protein